MTQNLTDFSQPLLNYMGAPVGNRIDMYMYIYLSGIQFAIVFSSFFFFRRQYVKAFLGIKSMIVERENFDAKSLATVATIPAFIGYSFISIGDMCNVVGSNNFAGYANWSVLLYMMGTSCFTSITGLLSTQLFIAIRKAKGLKRNSIVYYLGVLTAFYSIISPIIYIVLGFNNLGNYSKVFTNHNYQLFAEMAYSILMLLLTLGFSIYYKYFKNESFLRIYKGLCLIVLVMIEYSICALVFMLTEPLPASLWKTNETLIIAATSFVVLYTPSVAKTGHTGTSKSKTVKSSRTANKSGTTFQKGSTAEDLTSQTVITIENQSNYALGSNTSFEGVYDGDAC